MQDKFGDTALIIASGEGHIECATILLNHKADVNYQRKVRLLYILNDKEYPCSVA